MIGVLLNMDSIPLIRKALAVPMAIIGANIHVMGGRCAVRWLSHGTGKAVAPGAIAAGAVGCDKALLSHERNVSQE